jgi:signal transduction histidine kinase
VSEHFLRVRYLIAGVLAAGLLVGALLGWLLALDLARPLRGVTATVVQIARGERTPQLPERGPEEVRSLSHSVNILVTRLHDVEQARQQLLANLVHELGRPLGAIGSATRALQGGADQDAALRQELLAGIDAELHQLRRALDDLTRLHERVVGPLPLKCQATPLAEWLHDQLVPWREAAHTKGLRWQTTVRSELPSLSVDPDRLGQVLGNLLNNAIKFTPVGGEVSVSADRAEDEVWIRVSDTGPGIALEDQERIFEPFYRGQKGRRFPQGMGLGLSIARELVVAHGGRLDVDSTPGLGSHFTLHLPLIAPDS